MGQMVNTTTTATQAVKHNQAQMKTGNEVARSTIFLHALAFVFGFGLIFTLLGSAAGLLGQNLVTILPVIQKTGAILLLIFGLTTMGAFKYTAHFINERANLEANPALALLVRILDFFNTLLYTERRVTEMHNVNQGWGYLSSIFMGVSFSAGWVPCVGPILASILFLASNGTTATQGAILLAIYSVGLGIPFLITGAAFGSATKTLRKLNRHANIVSIISGIFLLYVAKLLWFDELALLTTQFTFLNEWVVVLEDQVSGVFGLGSLGIDNVNVISAAPLALIAGLISFISPCVLPLVPAYIGYLSGASLNTQ